MEEPVVGEEEDKKQFDAINGGQDAETEPDPDESLIMDSGNGRVWLVKVRTPPSGHPPSRPHLHRSLNTSWSAGCP